MLKGGMRKAGLDESGLNRRKRKQTERMSKAVGPLSAALPS